MSDCVGLCRYASCITVGAYRPRRVTLQQVMVWLTTHFLNPEEVATRGEEGHRAEAIARAPARQGRAVTGLIGLPAWQVQEYRLGRLGVALAPLIRL